MSVSGESAWQTPAVVVAFDPVRLGLLDHQCRPLRTATPWNIQLTKTYIHFDNFPLKKQLLVKHFYIINVMLNTLVSDTQPF